MREVKQAEQVFCPETDPIALCGQLPAVFHDVTPIIRDGDPAEEWLKTITAEESDLTVVGARR